MEIMLFRSKTCHILLSPISVAESLTSVAEVLTILSPLHDKSFIQFCGDNRGCISHLSGLSLRQ